MNSKHLVVGSLLLSSLLFTASPVLAADDFGLNRLIRQEDRAQNQASLTAQRQENNLTNLKTRADKAIDNRIAQLNRLLGRIQNDSRLSADEKSTLSANIQTDITGLTSLKAKIDADTDITVARTDVKSIGNFKIFAVVVPQTRILITIDNLSALTLRLQGLTPKIQDLINNLKSQGKDVSGLQPLLDDINAQLSTINSKLSSDKATVLAVTATSPNAQATFVSTRQDLASVRQLFAKIRADIAQMRVAFKGAVHNTTGGPTSSPTVSPSPSAT